MLSPRDRQTRRFQAGVQLMLVNDRFHVDVVDHWDGCHPDPEGIVWTAEVPKFSREHCGTLVEPVVKPLETPRHVEGHVLDFTHGHWFASIGTADRTYERFRDAVGCAM